MVLKEVENFPPTVQKVSYPATDMVVKEQGNVTRFESQGEIPNCNQGYPASKRWRGNLYLSTIGTRLTLPLGF
jgi:hypothetical protein